MLFSIRIMKRPVLLQVDQSTLLTACKPLIILTFVGSINETPPCKSGLTGQKNPVRPLFLCVSVPNAIGSGAELSAAPFRKSKRRSAVLSRTKKRIPCFDYIRLSRPGKPSRTDRALYPAGCRSARHKAFARASRSGYH